MWFVWGSGWEQLIGRLSLANSTVLILCPHDAQPPLYTSYTVHVWLHAELLVEHSR